MVVGYTPSSDHIRITRVISDVIGPCEIIVLQRHVSFIFRFRKSKRPLFYKSPWCPEGLKNVSKDYATTRQQEQQSGLANIAISNKSIY